MYMQIADMVTVAWLADFQTSVDVILLCLGNRLVKTADVQVAVSAVSQWMKIH